MEKIEKDVSELRTGMTSMKQILGAMQKQMEKLKVLDLMEQKFQREEDVRIVRLEKAVVEDTPVSGKIDGVLFYGLESVGANKKHPIQSPQVTKERGEPLTRRMELPVFDGSNAESWVLRVDQYFELGEHSETEKLHAVRVCFDDDALLWYRWERDRNPFRSWEDMKRRVIQNFSTRKSNPCEKLMMMRQTVSVRDYNREFIILASNNQLLSEQVLESASMVGLRPEIGVRIRLHEPKCLEKMMTLAIWVEDCLLVDKEPTRGVQERAIYSSKYPSPRVNYVGRDDQSKHTGAILSKLKVTHAPEKQTAPYDRFGKTLTHPNRNTRKHQPYRRLSPEEKREKQEKGLCFKCDGRYGPNHQCQLQALQVYIVNDDGTEVLVEDDDEVVEAEEAQIGPELAELSLNSVIRISSPRTMKVRGETMKQPIVVLIDSRASHNFISVELVRKLAIPLQGTTGYGVLMGVETSKGKLLGTSRNAGKRHKFWHKHKKRIVMVISFHKKRVFVDQVFIMNKRTRLKLEREYTNLNCVQTVVYVKLLWRFITVKKNQLLSSFCAKKKIEDDMSDIGHRANRELLLQSTQRKKKGKRSNQRLTTTVCGRVFLSLLTASNQIINDDTTQRAKTKGILTALVLWGNECWSKYETAIRNLWQERKHPSSNEFQRRKLMSSPRKKGNLENCSCAGAPTYCNSLLDPFSNETLYAQALVFWVVGYLKCSLGRFPEFIESDRQNKRRSWAYDVLAVDNESKEERFRNLEKLKNNHKKECQDGVVRGCKLRNKGLFVKKLLGSLVLDNVGIKFLEGYGSAHLVLGDSTCSTKVRNTKSKVHSTTHLEDKVNFGQRGIDRSSDLEG